MSAESRILSPDGWMPHASNLRDERCRRGRRNPNARRKVIIKFTASFGFAATGLEGERGRGRGERIVFRSLPAIRRRGPPLPPLSIPNRPLVAHHSQGDLGFRRQSFSASLST